jgi:hypothetical protein
MRFSEPFRNSGVEVMALEFVPVDLGRFRVAWVLLVPWRPALGSASGARCQPPPVTRFLGG